MKRIQTTRRTGNAIVARRQVLIAGDVRERGSEARFLIDYIQREEDPAAGNACLHDSRSLTRQAIPSRAQNVYRLPEYLTPRGACFRGDAFDRMEAMVQMVEV